MIARSLRLRFNKRHPLIGSKIHSPYFTVIYQPTPKPISQMAVIVSKKVSPLAVKRNLLKRRIYHLSSPYLTQPSAHDFIIIIKPPCLSASFLDLKNNLLSILNSIYNNQSHIKPTGI